MVKRAGELEQRGADLLASIGDAADRIGGGRLTLHWPTVGAAFDHGVLVVGQAVYGWMNNWTAAEARDPQARRRIIAEARDPFPHLKDPMGWIDGHHARISPFWTVGHRVTDQFAPGDAPWFSRLAWANLYPVAPNDVKSNPSGALREAQTQAAATFFATAVRVIEPRMVLVLGGPYAWDFYDQLQLKRLDRADTPLYRVGVREGITWAVGMHPAGASRRRVGPRDYSEKIITAARPFLTPTSR